MKLTFLGTGAPAAFMKRNTVSIYFEVDKKKILLDCGYGTLSAMREKKIDFEKIDLVFISHLHPDHIADLWPLVFLTHALRKWDLKNYRKKPLQFWGNKLLSPYIKQQRKMTWKGENLDFDLSINRLAKFKKFDNLTVSAIETNHYKMPSLAFKFDCGGKSFIFSGDIGWGDKIPAFIEFCKGVDVLIIDGGKAIGYEGTKHLEPFQISQLARDANPKKVVVVHLTDIDSPAQIKDAISEFYKGEVLIARDGMELKV
jgi:ribonuclease BN (tRNA processing enzyme)